MGRRTSEKEIKNLIEKIRTAGDVAIRSTFIVGFPGETDEQYQKLYDFIGEYKLNYAGYLIRRGDVLWVVGEKANIAALTQVVRGKK